MKYKYDNTNSPAVRRSIQDGRPGSEEAWNCSWDEMKGRGRGVGGWRLTDCAGEVMGRCLIVKRRN